MSELIGQTIGNYQIEALLGVGGMGKVFRGRHIHLKRAAAIKVMHDNLASDPGFQARFLNEARAIAELEHSNIVEVHDFGEQNGRFYLVLELLTDGSLRTLLQRRARANTAWPLVLGLDLARQTADALAYAHQQGIVHRDIKPDNMLLKAVPGVPRDSDQYILKLGDFGLVKIAAGSILTATGTALGTPAYMSPEQCQGLDLDGRSDVYSLGVVLYEVMTGYLPFQAKTLSEAAYKHVYAQPPAPRTLRADLPAAVEAIILRCLAKKPDERYTAAELSSALRQSLINPSQVLTVPTVIEPQVSPLQSPPKTPQAASTSQVGTVAREPSNTPPPTFATRPGTSRLPQVQVLDAQKQARQLVEVGTAGVTIGRGRTNTIALDDDAVSRQHLRVDWDGNRVTVMDVGSSNGTFLDGTRLTPQTPVPWSPQEMLHVGPFWLRLVPAASPDSLLQELMSGATRLQNPSPTRIITPPNAQVSISSARIGVALDQPSLTLTPGRPEVVHVTVANLGSTVDHFKVTVEGVPAAWVQVPDEWEQLNPGNKLDVAFNVTVPRSPESRAGDYSVIVRAKSRDNPGESGKAFARWTVLPFAESTLAVSPSRASGHTGADYQVIVQNKGNAPATYTLASMDDERALTYNYIQKQIAVPPGESVTTALSVRGRQRLIGSAQARTFTVQSETADRVPAQTTTAQFVHQALIPMWIPPIAIAVLLVLCFGLYSLFARPPVIESVSLDPPNPRVGQAVTLHWRVDNAQRVELRPLGIDLDPTLGQYTFPQGSTFPPGLTLIASNRFSQASQPVSIVPIEPTAKPTQMPTPTTPPTGAPTAIPTTAPIVVPPTAVPPTAVPPTAVPPTAVPPTAVPPTAVPPQCIR